MRKKLIEITDSDKQEKCIYPNCFKCSLNLIDVNPNCIYHLLEEKERLTKRLNYINEILEKNKDKEIEVEDNE